jgi:teichuronic acid biosynthesis glycosyltransferase TuaC
MKVLQVTNAYPTANSPIYGIFVKEQIESLQEINGLTSDIYFINAREKGIREYLRSLVSLREKIRGYDIIHCHHVFCALVVLMISSKENRIVVSFLSQGTIEFNTRHKIPFANELFKYILRNADARIFKFGLPKDLINDKNSHYIPNGVNMSLFRPIDKREAKKKLNLDPEKRYILFVSSNYLERPVKRYDKFMATFDILKSKYSILDIEPLLLVNEKRERVPLYFNASDIHLLTSDVEGSPNSVKESLACNTPVVSTNVGNVVDLLSNVKNCHISYNKSPEELAEYCSFVLANSEKVDLRERIIELRLDMRSVAERIIQVYKAMQFPLQSL